LNTSIRLDPDFIDPYFLMLDFFYNEKLNAQAADTIKAIRQHFTELDERETNMLNYHTADVEGRNADVYRYFLKEYAEDPKDMFTNNSGMVIAMMYKHDPRKALEFFNEIPMDSVQVEGCYYCAERLEQAMWSALDIDSMTLADKLAPKMETALYTRKSYGSLIMYYVWKKDTLKIDQLIIDARHHPAYNETWEYLNYLAGRLFLLRGDKELSLHYAQEAIQAYLPFPNQIRMLGKSYYLNNQLDKALASLKTALVKLPEESRTLPEIGTVYARQANKVEAKKVIDQLEALRKPFDYGATEYFQGRIYALLGDKEKAVQLLQTSIKKGQKYDLWVTFDHDPDLMVLKGYPPYVEMMEGFQ
jgi:tetratricopeptide (TPR) repeat protein